MEKTCNYKKAYTTAIVLLCAILFLTIANYTKVFHGGDDITKALFWNSENLVYNAMVLDYYDEEESKYGLSDLYPYSGTYTGSITDEKMKLFQGYNTVEPVIVVHNNEYTRMIFAVGNTLIFFSGDEATITKISEDGENLFVEYDADKIYNCDEQGDLRYVIAYSNEKDKYYEMGSNVPYESQIGLQGKVFCMYPKENTIHEMKVVYKWLLSALFATVICLICYGIYKKYNLLFAIVFYTVTAISPWIIGYSTNLYWVEFTWFLPMLCGIICANHIDNKKVRIGSYIGVMLSTAIKSACGYEFITTVMLSAIVFLLADFTIALIEQKDRKKIKRLFGTIFVMGIFALLGFGIALVWHAYLRGAGNIYNGLRAIYYNDVLRRTFGDPNMFQDVYADSLNASVIRVLLRYLIFKTPIILGVPGVLFLPLAMLSFFILLYGVWKKKENKHIMALYVWMGIASVSWFILGKSHSYIHTGMNFVMWYFGYIQIVFYVLVQAVWNVAKKVRKMK